MGSSFFGLRIGLSALQTFQKAQDLIGQNISNVQTPGYTRQVPELESAGGSTSEVGGGVRLARVRRLRDAFADAQVRASANQAGEARSVRDLLLELQEATNPLADGSLLTAVDDLHDAFQELSKAPVDAGVRASAVARAEAVADILNGRVSELEGTMSRLHDRIRGETDEFNRRLREVAELNQAIITTEGAGRSAAGLRDQRDLRIDELSKQADIDLIEADSGVGIALGGRLLVSGRRAEAVSVVSSGGPPVTVSLESASGQPLKVGSGRLAGLAQGQSRAVQLIADLEALRDALGSSSPGSINAVQLAGYTQAELPSVRPLFVQDAAGRLSVDTAVSADPALLAAAASPAAGDGSNALGLAAALDAPSVGGLSARDFLAKLASTLGIETADAESQASQAAVVEDAARSRRDAASGVSLDEETVHLIEFEQGYAAAARYIRSVNDMFDELLRIAS